MTLFWVFTIKRTTLPHSQDPFHPPFYLFHGQRNLFLCEDFCEPASPVRARAFGLEALPLTRRLLTPGSGFAAKTSTSVSRAWVRLSCLGCLEAGIDLSM